MNEEPCIQTPIIAESFSQTTSGVSPANSRWKPRVNGLLLIAVGVITYSNSFDVPFLFDDQNAIEDNTFIRALWPLDRAMSAPPQSTGAGRPILNLSLAINYHFNGLRVWGYHAVNLGIHIAVGLLLMGLIRRTLALRALRDRFGGASDELAFAATMLWLVHPLQTESVTYIVQRAESLAALFYVATLYAFLRGATGGRRAWFAFSFAACATGMATKETVVTAPLMVLLFDRFFVSGNLRCAISRRRIYYAGLAATWIVLAFIMSTGPRSQSAGFGDGLPTPWRYALAQFEVIVHYLKLIFYPSRLCLDYAWPVPESIGQVSGSMSLILFLVAVTVWGLWRRAAWAFCGCWFFLILSPTSSFVPIADAAFEHRVYLPLAGVTTLIVCGAYWLMVRRRSRESTKAGMPARRTPGVTSIAAWTTLVAVTLTLGWRTRLRNETYRSDVVIWSDVLEQRPQNARAEYNLAWAQFKRGEHDSVEAGLRRAIDIDPEYAAPRSLLAVLLSNLGRVDEAKSEARHAAELEPRNAEYQYNLGLILSRAGHDDEAAQAYQSAIHLRPDYADAWYNLGNLHIRANRIPDAVQNLTKAIELDPNSIGARFNLAGLLKQMGRDGDAERIIHEAMEIAKASAQSARAEGRLRDASEYQGKVVQIRPNDAGERLQWARDLAAMGNKDGALAQCAEAEKLGAEVSAKQLRIAIEAGRLGN